MLRADQPIADSLQKQLEEIKKIDRKERYINELAKLLSNNPRDSAYFKQFESYLSGVSKDVKRLATGMISVAILFSYDEVIEGTVVGEKTWSESLLPKHDSSVNIPINFFHDERFSPYLFLFIQSMHPDSPLNLMTPSDAKPLPSHTMQELSNAISKAKLQSVRIHGTDLSHSPTINTIIFHALDSLFSSESIISLDLENTNLSNLAKNYPKDFDIFCEKLKNSHIETLDLSQNDLNLLKTDQLTKLADALVQNKHLKNLYLAYINLDKFTDEQITHFFTPLSKASHLKSLDLEYNDIYKLTSDTSIKALSQLITSNNLEHINLEGNNLGHMQKHGFNLLCNAFHNCSAKDLFILQGNNFQKKYLTALDNALSDNFNVIKISSIADLGNKQVATHLQQYIKRNAEIQRHNAEIQRHIGAGTLQKREFVIAEVGIHYGPNAIALRKKMRDENMQAMLKDIPIPPELDVLFAAIDELGRYGNQLILEGSKKKGEDASYFAQQLEETTNNFFKSLHYKIDDIPQDKWATFTNSIERLYGEHKNTLASHRVAATLGWNILVCITGIGALALAAYMAYTKVRYDHALFFGQKKHTTTREDKFHEVKEKIDHVGKKSQPKK